MKRALALFAEDIKLEHTLFALPFAYVGALLARMSVPDAHTLAWVTVAVIGARTAGMAANRLLDAKMDARNPRTQQRAVASGKLPGSVMVWAIAIGLTMLAAAAWQLNPLCFALVPVGAAAVVAYPLVKRYTWAVHFVLGAVDGLAPLGAWLAVTGRFEPGAILLFAAVTLWVAGFDIWYALMDRDFDLREGVQSVPARFGERPGRLLPQLLHGMVVVALVWLGVTVHARPLYWIGVVAAVALVGYELLLVARQRDLLRLSAAVFTANMAFSVIFFMTTTASLLVPKG